MAGEPSAVREHLTQFVSNGPALGVTRDDSNRSGWMVPTFDAAAWASRPDGFGTASTPGAIAGTTWNTPDIWIRRTFDLPAGFEAVNPQLFIHHDEDAEVTSTVCWLEDRRVFH